MHLTICYKIINSESSLKGKNAECIILSSVIRHILILSHFF